MQAEAVRIVAPIAAGMAPAEAIFGIVWLVGLLVAATWVAFKKEEEN